ncbi:MAG: site-specific integrase [Puniceicoccales bacterium]|jgi:integrase|nr:site-specific integrase [Puniceicoccales bacterium]
MKVSKNSMNFTKLALMALPIPPKGMITFCDSKEKDLSLYVTATGHKSFFIQKRIQGKIKRIILGHFPDMTVELARKAAQKIKGQIAEGKNPCEEKHKLSGEKTFGEAFQMYIERYAKIEKKESSRREDERQVNRFLQHWFKRPLSTITKYEIQTFHERIGSENGKYAANRLLACISTIYNKMIAWGWEGANPATRIKKFKEQKRDRFILHDELPKFMEALESEPNRDMRDFFLMCLYTGARCGNVSEMRWEDIDFSINEWRIPDTKNGEAVRIPLINQALEILQSRVSSKASIPWVFPSNRSKLGHLTETKTAWRRVLNRAGLKNLRIHDLRRTNGSYQAIAGVSLVVIGKSLGHKSPQSTAIYARLSNDPVRAGLEAAFDFTTKNQ